MRKSYLFIYFIIGLAIFKLNNNIVLADQITISGDVNNDGKTNAQDYILVRKYLLKQITFSNEEFKRADTNSDNQITSLDYINIRKILLDTSSSTELSLNTGDREMDAGSTFKLVPSISNGISYTSSNSSVAKVDSNGLITARHEGKTTIMAKTNEGNKEVKINITVKNGNPHLFGWSQTEADKQFGTILDGLFTGKTKESITDKSIGSQFAFHFPDMVYINGKIYAYYISYANKSGHGGVGLAISEDGINWDNKGCVLEPDQDYDRSEASFAGIWYDNGTFYLTYESKGDPNSKYGVGQNIALAISKDGIHFEKKGVILYKDTKSTWQNQNIGTPDLFKVGNTWYLTFHGYNGTDCQIGVASGKDLYNLKMESNPIIPTEDNTKHSGTTGRRDIIYVDGWYYMVYEVSTDRTPGHIFEYSYWSHQFARSRDMINWQTTSEPFLTLKDENNNPLNSYAYDGPCWGIIDDHIYVYYRKGGTIRNDPLTTERAELTLK